MPTLLPLLYNPSSPIEDDASFINQDEIVQSVHTIVCRHPPRKSSCVIIGGSGMGKTSVLHRLNRLLNFESIPETPALHYPKLIPIYISIERLLKDFHGTLTLSTLLKELSSEIMIGWATLGYRPRRVIQSNDYGVKDFRGELRENLLNFGQKLGKDYVRLVIFLDDVDRLMNYPQISIEFAESIVSLLDEGDDFRDYVAFIMTCRFDLNQSLKTAKTRSIYEVVERVYLKPMSRSAGKEVVLHPIKEFEEIVIGEEIIEEIHHWAGGHPRIIHLVMQSICESFNDPHEFNNLNNLEVAYIQKHGYQIAENYQYMGEQIFQLEHEMPQIRKVLSFLKSKPEPASFGVIQNELRPEFDLDAVLQALEYFGFIYREGIGPARSFMLSGKVFREWSERFLRIHPLEADIRHMTKEQNAAKLQNFLNRYFNIEELRQFCFTLGVDYDEIPGDTKTYKARELVLYFERRECLPELERELMRVRPIIE